MDHFDSVHGAVSQLSVQLQWGLKQTKVQAGPEMQKMCRYFHLQVFIGSVNNQAKEEQDATILVCPLRGYKKNKEV